MMGQFLERCCRLNVRVKVYETKQNIVPLEPESCKLKNATFQEKHFLNL